MPRSKLLLSVELYREMSSKKVVGADLRGRVALCDKSKALLDEISDRGMNLDSDYGGRANGAEIEVDLALPRGQSEFFAETWQDLLNSHTFKFAAPQEYFVANDDALSTEGKETTGSRRYTAILKLITVLQETADYADASMEGLKFVYLTTTKFELPVLYNFVSFRDTPGISELASDFASTSAKHKDQRKIIVKVVLNEMLANIPPELRFKELLENFPEFIRRVKDGYDLYVAEFSFEKVLEEVETHKLDYTIKLNKVFSDIQSQLLAIPAALILVGSQLSDRQNFDWKNFVIFLGLITYAALMDLLIRNQYNSLAAIGTEIKLQKEHLIKKHAAVRGNFDVAYNALDKRYKHQKILIKTVDGLVAMMIFVSSVLFLWYSTPKEYWLKVLLQDL